MKTPKTDENQRGLASMIYKFFDKKSKDIDTSSARTAYVSGGAIKTKIMLNHQLALRLADELYNPFITKFNKRKGYSSFKDDIWAVKLS